MRNHPFPAYTARFVLAALRWLSAVILVIAGPLALAADPPRNVLVLYSDNRVLPGLAVIDETLDSVLRAIWTRDRAVQRFSCSGWIASRLRG